MTELLRRPATARALHLAVLCSLAVAQPLFDLLGNNAEFFVAHDATGWDITLLALGLTLLPPAALILTETLAGLVGDRLRDGLHLVLVGLLCALIALQALVRAVGDLPGVILLIAAAAIGACAAWIYFHQQTARSFLTFLGPAPIAFIALFLLTPPISKLTVGGSAEAQTVGSAASAPVVVIVFDEFPTTSLLDDQGRIDAERYPNFAALAKDATWFPNATSVADATTWAVPAILTGNRPERDQLPIASDHPRSLFTLLGESHRMVVNEEVTDVCPESLCADAENASFGSRFGTLLSDVRAVYPHLVLPDDLREGLTPIDSSWRDFGRTVDSPTQAADNALGGTPADRILDSVVQAAANNRIDRFDRLLSSITPRGRPSLYFNHVMLPHVPWQYLPSGKTYGAGLDLGLPGLETEKWGSDQEPILRAYQRHLLQVGFVDRQVGRLVSRLRETGLYDESLIVITADHGVSFRPRDPRRGVTVTNIEDQAPVPLFIKAPGGHAAEVDKRTVTTIDVLPTIADMLGIRDVWRMDGRSVLRDGWRTAEALRVFSANGPTVRLSLDAFDRRRAAALARQVKLMGVGDWDDSVFVAGPAPELTGRPVRSFPSALRSGLTAEIEGGHLFQQVALDAPSLPAFMVGHTSGPDAGAVDLAIALNGRVAATTRTFDVGNGATFQALLPKRFLRDGDNEVQVFALRDGARRLEALTGKGVATGDYRLESDITRLVIRPPSGPLVDVVPESVQGYIEGVVPTRTNIRVSGWAATARGPADRIVVFSGKNFLYGLQPQLERTGVAKELGFPRRKPAGFSLELPKEVLGADADGSTIRVFAIRGHLASELERLQ